jgi:hypothetical protein
MALRYRGTKTIPVKEDIVIAPVCWGGGWIRVSTTNSARMNPAF